MTKDFWIIFIEKEGHTNAFTCGHNCVADWRDMKGFLGWEKATVDMDKLKK